MNEEEIAAMNAGSDVVHTYTVINLGCGGREAADSYAEGIVNIRGALVGPGCHGVLLFAYDGHVCLHVRKSDAYILAFANGHGKFYLEVPGCGVENAEALACGAAYADLLTDVGAELASANLIGAIWALANHEADMVFSESEKKALGRLVICVSEASRFELFRRELVNIIKWSLHYKLSAAWFGRFHNWNNAGFGLLG